MLPRCSAYAVGERSPVPASGLWSGSDSKVSQFLHVPTSVDTQHFIQIHARVFLVILHQTNERKCAGENIYLLRCRRWI